MSPILRTEWIWWACVAAALAYLLTAAVVIVSRRGFERRRRVLERVERHLANGVAGRRAAVAALGSAPLSHLWSLGGDASVPRPIHHAVADALLRRVGAGRLSQTAARQARWGPRRIAALRALALTGAPDIWRLLALALSDANGVALAATIGLLGELEDPRAGDLLVEALKAGRYPRSRIATAIESSSVNTRHLLVPLLSATDAGVRFWGPMLLARYTTTPDVTGRLEVLASDADPMVRKAALYALARMGGRGTGPVAVLALQDPVPFVRAYAIRALGALSAVEHLSAITPLLADRDWWVRSAVKEALVAAGPAVESALVPYLSHPDYFARNGAAEVLQNTGGFERLLMIEARGPSNPRRLAVLEMLASAGGLRMWDGVLLRLPPEAQTRAREILQTTHLFSGA